jgi:predicted RNase H-like HicB family nuclease
VDRSCRLHGLVRREGDFWVALVLEFDVMGTGDTIEQAIRMARELTIEYVHEQRDLGRSAREIAKRHVPRRYWVLYYALRALGRTLPDHDHHTSTRATFRELAPLPC